MSGLDKAVDAVEIKAIQEDLRSEEGKMRELEEQELSSRRITLDLMIRVRKLMYILQTKEAKLLPDAKSWSVLDLPPPFRSPDRTTPTTAELLGHARSLHSAATKKNLKKLPAKPRSKRWKTGLPPSSSAPAQPPKRRPKPPTDHEKLVEATERMSASVRRLQEERSALEETRRRENEELRALLRKQNEELARLKQYVEEVDMRNKTLQQQRASSHPKSGPGGGSGTGGSGGGGRRRALGAERKRLPLDRPLTAPAFPKKERGGQNGASDTGRKEARCKQGKQTWDTGKKKKKKKTKTKARNDRVDFGAGSQGQPSVGSLASSQQYLEDALQRAERQLAMQELQLEKLSTRGAEKRQRTHNNSLEP